MRYPPCRCLYIQLYSVEPRGLLQTNPALHLQTELLSPEVLPGLVTPTDLRWLLEAFSTQNIPKDSSCGSKGFHSAPSLSLARLVSPHFLEATRNCAGLHAWGRA